LVIQFKKRNDGAVVLQFVRPDGSQTGKRYDKHGVFFSHHDLTHYAVETTLGFKQGFYGLVAGGWDIADTDGQGPRGKPPLEAILVEHIVGLFSSEAIGGNSPLAAAEFNSQLRAMIDAKGIPLARKFTNSELHATREYIRSLHTRWASVPNGAALELTFAL